MADFRETVFSSLRRRGIERADEIASGLISDIRRELGGQSFYVRRAYDQRNAKIRAAYTGRNADELARQYGLNRRTIINLT
jgi:Mor family transcriptional regulator